MDFFGRGRLRHGRQSAAAPDATTPRIEQARPHG